MNTKTFAQEARKILMQGVAKKLLYWGFNAKGEVLEQPEKVSGGYSFRGEVFDDPSVPNLWQSLENAIKSKGIDVVVEEAAYTWFNRIMALRILVKNGYEDPQLEDAEGLKHTPIILQKARQGKSDFLTTEEKNRLQKILTDYSKDQEAFAILIKGYCHSHKTLQRVFGKIDDYTELLLPDNMLQTNGFLHLLNTTEAISDEDYQKVELIGWLYQFYISEKKDEIERALKTKNKKVSKEDIPADTQIFTPNWIVKYMVENTAGKIWLDKHPNSNLKSQMKYLVENESDNNDSSSAVENSIISNVEELTLIDPAAGSGHILVEGFDLMYKMYLEEYYTPEEAVQSILKYNLFGLDIDDRAAQLATFAILLKAAKVYPAIWTKDWLPNVYAMPEAEDFSLQEIKDFLGEDGTNFTEELDAALRLMQQAKNLGSVMKLNIGEEVREHIEERFYEIKNSEFRDFNIEAIYQKLSNFIPVLILLTKKYTSVVANPPYMGWKKMNAELKSYLAKFYTYSKSDLMTVFMECTTEMLCSNGLAGIVNLDSWMFGSSYEKLRTSLISTNNIESLIHIGWNAFPDGHTYNRGVTYTLRKNKSIQPFGVFVNLSNVEATVDKRKLFLERKLNRSNFYIKSSLDFNLIPQTPIAYWAGENTYTAFRDNVIGDLFPVKKGMDTGGNNDLFLRFWFEVSRQKIGYDNKTSEAFLSSNKKWAPYNKGGEFRKWYGNNLIIINWENSASKLKSHKPNFRSKHLYFNDGITWGAVSSKGFSSRITNYGAVFDSAGSSMFPKGLDETYHVLGLSNSKTSTHFMGIINPTINFGSGTVSKIPYVNKNKEILDYSKECIKLSKRDWCFKEVSWEFKSQRLLKNTKTIEQAYSTWQKEVTIDFFQLHRYEEELNKIFIDIYGLQEELTPEVELKDITILQEELNKKDLEKLEEVFRAQGAEAIELPINKAEVISQFISYAIGLFMGRYRLDKPGLNIAHPNPTKEKLENYSYNNGNITIDEDAILPLMGAACNFPDDALQQIYNLLDVIWGTETRTDNINFIQECLNKDLEKFLVTDFYKFHCKMYNKKPIYWLFASKKGAFQVLVYMHRMNAFTVEKIRANYLLEHIKNIDSEISLLESNEASLNTQEAKKLEQLRKNLQECYEYDTELKDMADKQITFDLDDGVTVNYKKFETVVAKIK